MYHRHSSGSISFAEFRHLGKTGNLGKYSLHFHRVGDTMRGSSVVGASIWDSGNRWITIHGTNFLCVRDCVGYRSVGHGFFLEDGTEVDNILDGNLAVQACQGRRFLVRSCRSTTTKAPVSGGRIAAMRSFATWPSSATSMVSGMMRRRRPASMASSSSEARATCDAPWISARCRSFVSRITRHMHSVGTGSIWVEGPAPVRKGVWAMLALTIATRSPFGVCGSGMPTGPLRRQRRAC